MGNKMVSVKNRDSGSVGYTIPDLRIWRTFAPGEEKYISLDELKALQYVPGGEFTLKHLLMINDRDALSTLNIETEPEYFYTEVQIKELLTKGSLDELKDCLDFAPEGVIEIIKKMAVDIKLSDTAKREAIFKATGFSIDNAILVNKVMNEEPAEEQLEQKEKTRRVNPAATTPQRRVATPNYTIATPKK